MNTIDYQTLMDTDQSYSDNYDPDFHQAPEEYPKKCPMCGVGQRFLKLGGVYKSFVFCSFCVELFVCVYSIEWYLMTDVTDYNFYKNCYHRFPC